jgi:DNA (cytosine-5)-methyltransferase 1
LHEKYVQVGNAVPVRLGEVAGGIVAQQLDGLAKRKWKGNAAKTERYRIIYVQSHVRTRQWFKAGQTFVWKDGDDNGHAKYSGPKTKRRVKVMR